VRAAAPTAVLVKKLRSALDATLAARVGGDGSGVSDVGSSSGAAVVAAIVDLLQDEAAAMSAAAAGGVGRV